MSRTILLFFLLAVFSANSLFAQVKNQNIGGDYVLVKYKIGGAIEHLGSDKTYKLIYPQQLRYNKDKDNNYCWDNMRLLMDAQKAKDDTHPYITFEIVTTGLNPLPQFDDEQITIPAKGWVRKMYYNFPLRINVKNDKGELVKEIILHDDKEVFTGVFHNNFQSGEESPREGERTVIPFSTQDKLEKSYTNDTAAIEKRLEKNQAIKFYPEIARIIYAGYDYNTFPKTPLRFYTIKTEQQSNYAIIGEYSGKLSAALTDLQDDTKQYAAIAGLNEIGLFYKQQLANASSLPEDIVKLCLYNGALAAVTSGNIADADKWFSDYYVKYMNSPGLWQNTFETNFNNLYNVFAPYYILIQNSAQSVNAADLTLSAYADKAIVDKQAKEEKAKNDYWAKVAAENANPNIKGQQGYIVFKTGEKIEGRVTAIFINKHPKSNVIDLDFGKSILIERIIDGVDAKRYYKLKDIDYFAANNKQYDRIDVKIIGLSLLRPTPIDEFNIKQKQKGNFTLYKSATSGSYSIKPADNPKSFFVLDIMKNTKAAKELMEKYPALAQKISKDAASVDTAENLFNWMAENCN